MWSFLSYANKYIERVVESSMWIQDTPVHIGGIHFTLTENIREKCNIMVTWSTADDQS